MKLLILDLDGTVRIKKGGMVGEFESGFINSPTDQEIIPGAMSAIKKYHSEGWVIVGCSNQGGVASGHKTLDSCFVEQIYTLKLIPQVETIYFCPDYEGQQLGIVLSGQTHIFHGTREGAWFENLPSFRKPEPGMVKFIIEVQKENDDITEILMIGDRDTDEQCAIAANIPFQWAKDWWC